MGKVAAVVVAGGVGKRLGGRVRKSFVLLAGKPMLYWSLKALEATREVKAVVVAIHPNDLSRAKRAIRAWKFKKVFRVVAGGASRRESVYQGLKALPPQVQWVAIHDGARPLVTPEVIRTTLRTARKARAAVAAVPVVPTVKEVSQRTITKTLNRDRLWAVQTPQVFRHDLIRRAHENKRTRKLQATDDAALVEALGHPVQVAVGSHRNLKVTTPEDLVCAEALMRNGHGASRRRV